MSDVRSRRLLAAGVAVGLLALSGCASGADAGPPATVSTSDSDGLNGIVLPRAYDVPRVSLTDIHGASYDVRAGLKHKPLTLVFFGYTNCPDVCQVVMADIASAMTRLDATHRAKVQTLFVTTDPARDDATTLRSYVARFDPSFQGLTGPLPRIVTFGKALGVPIEKGVRLPTGGYDVTHGTQVVGVLPDGTAPVVWTQGTSPAQMAQDIRTILDHGVPTPPDASGSPS
ncbi:MAG: SCO family protein [Nocardioides sp.]